MTVEKTRTDSEEQINLLVTRTCEAAESSFVTVIVLTTVELFPLADYNADCKSLAREELSRK